MFINGHSLYPNATGTVDTQYQSYTAPTTMMVNIATNHYNGNGYGYFINEKYVNLVNGTHEGYS